MNMRLVKNFFQKKKVFENIKQRIEDVNYDKKYKYS